MHLDSIIFHGNLSEVLTLIERYGLELSSDIIEKLHSNQFYTSNKKVNHSTELIISYPIWITSYKEIINLYNTKNIQCNQQLLSYYINLILTLYINKFQSLLKVYHDKLLNKQQEFIKFIQIKVYYIEYIDEILQLTINGFSTLNLDLFQLKSIKGELIEMVIIQYTKLLTNNQDKYSLEINSAIYLKYLLLENIIRENYQQKYDLKLILNLLALDDENDYKIQQIFTLYNLKRNYLNS